MPEPLGGSLWLVGRWAHASPAQGGSCLCPRARLAMTFFALYGSFSKLFLGGERNPAGPGTGEAGHLPWHTDSPG